MKITFLHTSKVHIKRFEKLVRKFNQYIVIEHYINEPLLTMVMLTGQVDKVSFDKTIQKIKQDNTGIIICTCSTYGELCDETQNVYRIDKPIGKYIVANFSKIGIAYTVHSTKVVSQRLIENLANAIQKPVEIVEIDCQSSWQWFEKGDLERYELEIVTQIKKLANDCEIIFLAQASMEGTAKYLKNEDYRIVSSPEFGVKKYLELIYCRK